MYLQSTYIPITYINYVIYRNIYIYVLTTYDK